MIGHKDRHGYYYLVFFLQFSFSYKNVFWCGLQSKFSQTYSMKKFLCRNANSTVTSSFTLNRNGRLWLWAALSLSGVGITLNSQLMPIIKTMPGKTIVKIDEDFFDLLLLFWVVCCIRPVELSEEWFLWCFIILWIEFFELFTIKEFTLCSLLNWSKCLRVPWFVWWWKPIGFLLGVLWCYFEKFVYVNLSGTFALDDEW